MKFYDLIQKHSWEDTRDAIVRLYPDHESELDGYKQVFEKLKTLTPIPSNLQLRIELVYSNHTGEYLLETKSINPAQETGKTGSLFILEITPWAKWLGMELDAQTLEKFSEFDIVAHCLYEMTFFGFTLEDIQKTANAIGDSEN